MPQDAEGDPEGSYSTLNKILIRILMCSRKYPHSPPSKDCFRLNLPLLWKFLFLPLIPPSLLEFLMTLCGIACVEGGNGEGGREHRRKKSGLGARDESLTPRSPFFSLILAPFPLLHLQLLRSRLSVVGLWIFSGTTQ